MPKRSGWRRRAGGFGALAILASLTLLPSAAAQDDIETESITEQGTLDPFSADDRDLQEIFDKAENLFRSAEQPDSVALFDRLIARLESDHVREPLPPELLEMLIRSRAHRAEAHFNLGENDQVSEDFERILQLDPGWHIDPSLVSPKLVKVVDLLRRQTVGEIVVLVEPLDATVTVGGQTIEIVGQATAVLAGLQPLVIRRPGYGPVEEEIEIRAARSMTVEHTLERLSTVARIRVRPVGATVLVDGEPAQIAERTALPGAEADAGEEMAIEGLLAGKHVLEFRLAEHRPFRYGFEAIELDDYQLPEVVLEPMRGEIRLTELPNGAVVRFDSLPGTPTSTADGVTSFALAPGDHLIEVYQRGVGGFRHQISLGDQEIAEVSVRMRPTVAFLGVLGNDRLAASDLSTRLVSSLGQLRDWLWSDHSIDAPAVLDAAGLTAAEMRRLRGLASRRAAPAWPEIQRSFDTQFGASLYLLAVLADDLYATSADLWLWSAAPWPAAPGIRTVSIEAGDQGLEPLVAAFEMEALPSYLQFGARFIDSDGVVITSVIKGGPALAAGLAPGDRIVELSGRPVATVEELHQRARKLAGREAVLRIAADPAPPEIRLRVEERPGVLSLSDQTVIDQLVAARLALELLRGEGGAPRWLLELNQAALYLRAMSYQAAVPLLRTIEAPPGDGLGQPMVDYWLACSLLSLDPRGYAEAARGALERALGHPGARLYHDEGPLLAPRVLARLGELERTLGN